MFKDRSNYHKKIINQFAENLKNIDVTACFKSSDGVQLKATTMNSDSNVGIIFVPGIWYPREAYYKLLCALNYKYKVMIYDHRGQSRSHGDFNIKLMIEDLKGIIKQYKRDNFVQYLFIVGHSMGGYISAMATAATESADVTGQVLLAPPISMTSTQKKIPVRISIFKIYLLNLIRAIQKKYRSEIVKEYVSFWYPKFVKSPHLFALRADNPNKIIHEIKSTPSLSDTLSKFTVKTMCLWGNKDTTLGIKGQLPKLYQDFINNILKIDGLFTYELLDNLSHQFNIDAKRIIYIAGDNNLTEKKLSKFIEDIVKK